MSDTPRTQEELLVLRKEAEAEFMKYPGVFGVGLGIREQGGELTDEIAFRVYVDEKKPPEQLRPEETIPARYKGVPTDVLRKRYSTQSACDDHQQHSPLVGGVTISTLKTDSAGKVGLGTLGFFATINGGSAPHNVALVTNRHVVNDNGEAVGDTIYQPSWVDQGVACSRPYSTGAMRLVRSSTCRPRQIMPSRIRVEPRTATTLMPPR